MNVTYLSRQQKKQLETPMVTLQRCGILYINAAAAKDMGVGDAQFGIVSVDEESKLIKFKFQRGMIGYKEVRIQRTRPGPGASFRINVKKHLKMLEIKLNFSHVMSYDFDGDTLTLNVQRFVK